PQTASAARSTIGRTTAKKTILKQPRKVPPSCPMRENNTWLDLDRVLLPETLRPLQDPSITHGKTVSAGRNDDSSGLARRHQIRPARTDRIVCPPHESQPCGRR